MTPLQALEKAIAKAKSKKLLAGMIRHQPSSISNWLAAGQCSEKAAPLIEFATDVPRWQLRPDCYKRNGK